MKAAVILAKGNEEGETVFLADLLRRGGMECDLVSLDVPYVEGMHGIVVRADKVLQDELDEYDVLVLPGGSPAGAIIRADNRIRKIILDFDRNQKYLAGICFGACWLFMRRAY